ncbi:MAG: PfkB family carbohydrate kinase [Ignavibacteria bacterium]|nr:PfkB family carbohydrate kinase [Ignavibacteria bacterium]MDH7527454.1 PfkB family carbohydrate kinase [Ignavibacteria bacterium]
MSILVVGSLGLDTIETPFSKVEEALGGSAVYISLAASYFCPVVNLVGVVGEDFPKKYIELLREHHVDLEGLQIVPNGKTFRWSGKYDYDMNSRETLLTELNVFKDFNPVIPENYRDSKFIILGNIDPELQMNVLKQLHNPKFIVCDTMNYWIERKNEALHELLKMVDMLVVNDSEARLLARHPNLIQAAKIILKMGPKKLVIKKGEHGALLITNDTIFTAPAYPLENINDPTGAGDTFAGGMVGYLSKVNSINDDELKKAVIYGSVLASFCVEKFSVDGLLDLNYLKIKDRFNQFFQITHFEQ